MQPDFAYQRQRLHDTSRRLVATAAVFADPWEAGRMLDQAIELKSREHVLDRRALR